VRAAKDVPCFDCGVRYPYYVMDFDHLNPALKIKNVSQMRGCTIEQVQAEIEKCQVVCANCHRVRTHGRRPMRD